MDMRQAYNAVIDLINTLIDLDICENDTTWFGYADQDAIIKVCQVYAKTYSSADMSSINPSSKAFSADI